MKVRDATDLLDAAQPVLVVSPHLDDGIFSCGALLSHHPGSIVVTVFAGRPDNYGPLMPWDAASGFVEGDDVIARRRLEDSSAVAVVGARPVWLSFTDAQYGRTADIDQIAAAIEAELVRARLETVLVPVGLFHSDHVLTSDACLRLRDGYPDSRWFAYADGIYADLPDLLEARRGVLAAAGIETCGPFSFTGGIEAKRLAVRRYASQLRALSTPPCHGYDDVFKPERYYALESYG